MFRALSLGVVAAGLGCAAIGCSNTVQTAAQAEAPAGGASAATLAPQPEAADVPKRMQQPQIMAREDYYVAAGYSEPTRISTAARVTKEDVMAWSAHGICDEEIIGRVVRSDSTFTLSAADENQLRDAHVSDEVIRAMKATSKGYEK